MCGCARVWLSASVCLVWLFIGRAFGECLLPQHPAHGRHQPHGGECDRTVRPRACDGNPGTPAPEDWLLVVRCNHGYQHLDPNAGDVPSVCTNGRWSISELPKCVPPRQSISFSDKTSSSLATTLNIPVVQSPSQNKNHCMVPRPPPNAQFRVLSQECGDMSLPISSSVPHDCILIIYCVPGYHQQDGDGGYLVHCLNKFWSPSIPNDLCISKTSSSLATTLNIPVVQTPLQNKNQCTVPKPPPNAQFRTLTEECGGVTLPLASSVPHDCILVLYCVPGYRQQEGDGEFLIHCLNKFWSPSVPNYFCIGSGSSDTPRPVTTAPTRPTPPIVEVAPPQPTSLGPTTQVCVLPSQSASRKFCSLVTGCQGRCSFYDDRCLVSPGRRVHQTRPVCADGYTTRNQNGVSICLDNSWYPPIPECLKLCPPLLSEMLQMTCRHGTNVVNCSESALPDTTVSLECAPTFSEYPDLKRQGVYRRIHTCKTNGEWSDTLPICKPACGLFNNDIIEFSQTIVGGEKAYLGFFPWHAGLYYRTEKDGTVYWDQRCGGSLISDRVVLTAAHCVYGVIQDVSLLRIALGKYFRSWYREEHTQQKRFVSAIKIPSQYVSATVTFDIALVMLSERIKFGEFVMPVCRDFDHSTNHFRNNNLYVVGWGKTDSTIDGKASEELLFNTVTALPEKECRKSVPAFYTTFEKICAVKKGPESITQQGDSGGGLTAKYRDGLHYIVGIVSVRVNSVSIFTNVKWKTHIDWMETQIRHLENIYSS